MSGGAGAPAAPGGLAAAGGWLALAALLDTFDGRFARCFKRTSRQCRVSREIDSLVDVWAFGMAPVVVLESVLLPGSGLPAAVWWASAFAYVGAVVTRLSSYNVEAHDQRFVGLPAPAAALVCSTYLVAPDPALPWSVHSGLPPTTRCCGAGGSSGQQRARVLAGVKARRSAPPPLSRGLRS